MTRKQPVQVIAPPSLRLVTVTSRGPARGVGGDGQAGLEPGAGDDRRRAEGDARCPRS